MRFLFIANDFPNPFEPTRGVFNLNLARAMAKRHEVRVIAPIPWVDAIKGPGGLRGAPGMTPRVVDGIEVYHPTYYYPPKMLRTQYGWFYWRSIRRTVWHVLSSYTPDAVLGYWIHPDGEAAVKVAEVTGVPSAVIVGGSDLLLLPRQVSRRRCVERVLERADAVLTVSQHLRDKAVEFGVDAAKVHVWRQGVDVDRFKPGDRIAARQKLGLAVDVPTMVWVGRLVPVKAVDVLIDACAKLKARGQAFKLCLVGDGPLRKELEAQVAKLDLGSNVAFIGAQPQDSLPDWYRAADVALLPSWSEGLPNVLREAAACGTPFVASRVGGIPEIADPESDLMFTAGDSGELADAITTSLGRRRQAGRAATRSVGWDQSSDALASLMEPMVARARDIDHPWWIGRAPASKQRPGAGKRPLRQLARRVATSWLPQRLFMASGPRSTNAICLTFDDGPHPVNTPRVLDVLRQHRVKATFFAVGRMIDRYPELARRIIAEGHQLANHTYFHAGVERLTSREMLVGIERCDGTLKELGNQTSRCYRPPRGKVTTAQMLALWRHRYTVVLWTLDPKDYNCSSSDELARRVRDMQFRAGDVVLMHDRLPFAADVLPEFIQRVRAAGLGFATVDDWLAAAPHSTAAATVGRIAADAIP